ncbi:MAG: hypothetical protein ABI542_12235 [Gemmatimonadota bacterium]
MMIDRLRTPWLAALLLLASPAMGGLVLPVLHPCQAEQATDQAPTGHHGQSGHEGHHDQGSSGTHPCTCVGSCHVPALDAGPRITGPVAVVTPVVVHRPQLSPNTQAPQIRVPLDLLPPYTAPPIG